MSTSSSTTTRVYLLIRTSSPTSAKPTAIATYRVPLVPNPPAPDPGYYYDYLVVDGATWIAGRPVQDTSVEIKIQGWSTDLDAIVGRMREKVKEETMVQVEEKKKNGVNGLNGVNGINGVNGVNGADGANEAHETAEPKFERAPGYGDVTWHQGQVEEDIKATVEVEVGESEKRWVWWELLEVDTVGVF